MTCAVRIALILFQHANSGVLTFDAVVSHVTDFPGSQVLLMHFVWLLDVCHRMIGAWY